ncbi:MAG: 50S ribosomal protein L3 [Candidatus Brocadiia bacterium]
MVQGLLGRKIGMTQMWDDQETLRPATVLEVGPCVVLQVKSQDSDGYDAVQLGFGHKKFRRKHGKGEPRQPVERRGASKAELGHARKAGTAPRRFVREVGVEPGDQFELGQELTVEVWAEVSHVDVTGTTKGRGFQGTVKRHGFSRGPESHGSMNIRRPGSIGQSASPSRVFPGSRMPGHMGNARRTEKNLQVLRVDPEHNLLVVCGAVPGPSGGYVLVRPSARYAAGKKA